LDYLTTHTNLSPIRRGFAPGFVNYKKWCTRLADASDKVYQLFAHGRWFSPGTPASSTTKTGRHDIVEIKSNILKITLIKTANWVLKVIISYILEMCSHCNVLMQYFFTDRNSFLWHIICDLKSLLAMNLIKTENCVLKVIISYTWNVQSLQCFNAAFFLQT